MKKLAPLNFVDLFCGCGGFSYGLEQAGHRCLMGVDFDANAIQSFQKNHPDSQSFCGDIHQLSHHKLKKMLAGHKVDLVVGGPPCQGFSTVGKGDVADERNSLFKQFVRVVKNLDPEFIILENVTGLLAKKNQSVLTQIHQSFSRLGFHLSAQVLQSQNFGVPSQRRRTFIFGAKNYDPKLLIPKAKNQKTVTVAQAWRCLKKKDQLIDPYHNLEKVQLKNQLDYKRLSYIPEGRGIRYPQDEKKYLPKRYFLGIDWQSRPEQRLRQTKFLRLDRQKVAPTIMTAKNTYFHPVENRYLTPREAGLLQGFPKHFQFHGSYTAVFRQIGNAVPPLLAKSIGEHLLSQKMMKTLAHSKFNIQEIQKISSQAFDYKLVCSSSKQVIYEK